MGQKRDNDETPKRMKSKKEERLIAKNKRTGKALKIKEKRGNKVTQAEHKTIKGKRNNGRGTLKKECRWRKTGGEPELYQNQKNKIIIRKNFSKT